MTRADKKAYIDDLASQAEVSGHSEGRTRTGVQDHQARQRQVPQSRNTPIVDRQGRLLTTEAEKEARWVEHFSEVLNRPPPTT